MSRRESASTPRLYAGVLYGGEGSFAISDTGCWANWLAAHSTFYADLPDGSFTARRELRRGSWFWYAYRRSGGKLYKVYVGRSHELTYEHLCQVARQLAVKVVS